MSQDIAKPTSAFVMAFALLAIVSVARREDLFFLILAAREDGHVISWRIEQVAYGVDQRYGSRTGIAAVPVMDVALEGQAMPRTCAVEGQRAALGRTYDSESELRQALEQLAAQARVPVFALRRDATVVCRIHRSIDPGLLTIWAVFGVATAITGVVAFRARLAGGRS